MLTDFFANLHRFANTNIELYRNREGFHKSRKNLHRIFSNQDKSLGRFLHLSIEQILRELTTISSKQGNEPR